MGTISYSHIECQEPVLRVPVFKVGPFGEEVVSKLKWQVSFPASLDRTRCPHPREGLWCVAPSLLCSISSLRCHWPLWGPRGHVPRCHWPDVCEAHVLPCEHCLRNRREHGTNGQQNRRNTPGHSSRGFVLDLTRHLGRHWLSRQACARGPPSG